MVIGIQPTAKESPNYREFGSENQLLIFIYWHYGT